MLKGKSKYYQRVVLKRGYEVKIDIERGA